MRKVRSAGTVGVLLAALILLPAQAWGAHVDPIFVQGNATCGQLLNDPEALELKVEPVVDGTFSGNGLTVTIDVHSTTLGQTFDWTSSPGVNAVFVKGGPDGNLYVYDPPSTGDTGLHAPTNPSNGRYFGLSHISFCWVPTPSTVLSLNAASPSNLTIHSGDSVTLTFAEANDGNVVLSSPSVTADNGCTPAYDSGDTNSNGKLDPGETWLFKCTVTNITADTTITAIGHAVDHKGRDVTYCTDPSNPPANTFCDQDERTVVNVDVINPSTDLSLSASNPSNLTIHSGDSVTLTWAETNDAVDGSVLSNPSVTADNGCTPAYDSGDTNSNGKLDPGETWLFKCTVTNITADTTITAIAHGIDATGDDVTWCSDPTNPPANTFCDQDERAQAVINVINPSTSLSLNASSPGLNVPVGTDVTLTFAETNDAVDGTVLSSPSVTADNGCTPAYLSGDTDSDGKLDPGETWLFRCTVSNVQANTTITAIAHGFDDTGSDVTWCSDPTNPPANTFCDQDEIEVVNITVFVPGEGCTPGFWKQSQHFDSWTATGYSTGDSFEAIFGRDVPGTPTLLDALNTNGGGLRALIRHAAAALLNAAHPDVDYEFSEAQVIAMFQAAYDSGNYGPTIADFSEANEAGCPLS